MKRSDATLLRLAIVSTPRTGNNWLMHVLSRAYELTPLSPANPSNLAWNALPRRCVLILHWPRDLRLLELLTMHGFHVLSLARHPLDVLISILHFTLREATDGWLHGAGGDERGILGMTPCSSEFLDYACGPRARALLGVTCDWWADRSCHRVRYEDMLHDPVSAMERLAGELRIAPHHPFAAVVREASFAKLRRAAGRPDHYWQGQAGLWRKLLTAASAERIALAQQPCFTQLGYPADADHCLTNEAADAHWRALLQIDGQGDAVVASLQGALFDVRRELQQSRMRLARLEEAGPLTLSIALRFKHWAARFPRVGAALKKLLRRG